MNEEVTQDQAGSLGTSLPSGAVVRSRVRFQIESEVWTEDKEG